MEEALEMARAKDTKERMAGVERLHHYLEAARKPLSQSEATALVDCCTDLLKDPNFRIAQGALHAVASAAALSGDHLKLHFNALLPAAVERLGDAKQPVRDAARQLLITLMEVSSPTIIVERAGACGWAHRSWRVREEFLRTVAAAIGLFASTELTLPRVLLPHVLELLSDQNHTVREAAVLCIEEMYVHVGHQFHDELQRHNLPCIMVKEITARLEQIEPKVRQSNISGAHFISTEIKSLNLNLKRSSPKAKRAPRETQFSGGEIDTTEKSMDAIKVYSEKELVREIEKIISTLVPGKDWSVRITAMQRVEGLVIGGAVEYPSFPVLLKQLIAPLSIQLSDRRSSIVKQGCHLLCFLSKELLGDFEACAEMFIPVLFKLVVITVLVIAESADNCIKTMLRNCKVARVLPRIADAAKNDRSAILRARCCEYALLILEYWADAPEIQRSADLYEDLIKCCVADAMSEVRSTARACYRMFMKTWPERSRRLFVSFDPVIQRIISDEDGGIHKRYTSPSIRERGTQFSSNPSHGLPPGYGTSAIVPMDKRATSASEASHSPDTILLSQSVSQVKGSERTLEHMLNASKQKVSAIENLLRGINISDKQNSSIPCSTSLDLEVDPPSARDPPFPPAVPASDHLSLGDSLFADSTATTSVRVGLKNVDISLKDFSAPQIQVSKGSSILPFLNNLSSDSLSLLSLPSRSKISFERALEGNATEANAEFGSTRKISGMQIDGHIVDRPYKDARYRNSENGYVPNFQRPLLRKQVTGRASASGRRIDENQILVDNMSSYMDGPYSLSDALSEGLSPSSDWMTRIYAFNFVRTLLKQGPKGIQDVLQSFEKVMKLFFQHLDDPHHKIAQAALLTLADIIPACRKPFENYLERILPHVFSRLIDPKESVRQPCSATLEIIGRTYITDLLLPTFVRSLDEQRSPKAKLVVIEFANNSFNKHVVNSDGYSNSGFLKLWLAKLTPLVNDKNMKLKDASISGIISVYTHFDSASVLNFIVSLSLEEQNSLRRALKQYTPRIEVDLVNFLQSKKERQRSKSLYDQSDVVGTSSEEGYNGMPKKGHLFSRYSGDSVDSENGKKWNTTQESALDASADHASFTKTQEQIFQSIEQGFNSEIICPRGRELKNDADPGIETTDPWTNRQETKDSSMEHDNNAGTPMLGIDKFVKCYRSEAVSSTLNTEHIEDHYQNNSVEAHSPSSNDPGIPQLLHWVCNGNNENSSLNKKDALQKLAKASSINDYSIWTKYFNQILTAVLEVLDDPDSSIRELSVSLVSKMLTNQKEAMEDSIEIVIEKMLLVTKDGVAKVSNEARQCLTTVLAQYDPFRCLDVVVPLLVSDDEKTLVTCINFLTKLVGQLSQEELMIQLPSFIPSLFDAFRNQSPDVRKCVVFCLVDIYILLGKAFLPYLEGLSSTQLRLVTIYASRISQARSGASFNANNG